MMGNRIEVRTVFSDYCPTLDDYREIEVRYGQIHLSGQPFPEYKRLGFYCEIAAVNKCPIAKNCPVYSNAPSRPNGY